MLFNKGILKSELCFIYFKVKLQHLKILTRVRVELICAVFIRTKLIWREMSWTMLSQDISQILSLTIVQFVTKSLKQIKWSIKIELTKVTNDWSKLSSDHLLSNKSILHVELMFYLFLRWNCIIWRLWQVYNSWWEWNLFVQCLPSSKFF